MQNHNIRLLIDSLVDKFYGLLTRLLTLIRRSDGNEQLASLNQFAGYLKLFGKQRLPHVMKSQAHMQRLLLALVYIMVLDCNDVSPLLTTNMKDLDDPVYFYGSNSWKQFKFIKNSSCREKLVAICKLFGEFGDCRILVDTILEIMSDAPQHRKELTLLLNWILVSIKDPSVSHLYKEIVNFYTMQEAWYLPIEVFEDIPLIQAQSNHPKMDNKQRPKRFISKPSRYLTTSSDEAPKKQKKRGNITTEDIESDVHEIRNILEQDDSNSDWSDNDYQSHLSQHTYIHTDSQSHTNTQSHTSTQNTNVLSHTNSVPSYTNVQPHASIQSHSSTPVDANVSLHTKSVPSYVNVQPHTNIQSHSSTPVDANVSLHTNSVPSYVNVQPHTNIQSHTSTQLDANFSSYTNSVPSYVNAQPRANIQSHMNTSLDASVLSHTSIQPHIPHVPIVLCMSITHTLPTHSFINSSTHTQENNTTEQNILRTSSGLSHSSGRVEVPTQSEKTDENWRIRVETELKRMNVLLEKILKYVQDRQQVSQKPAILPISSLTEMETFETIDNDTYYDVVNYFRYIGGFNLKEAVNLCFKEGLKDIVTASFTWYGREGRQRPMYNTRFVMTIYEAVCNNKHFGKPTRSEFQAQMKEALRTAKERLRSKTRPRKQFVTDVTNHRNMWNDDA